MNDRAINLLEQYDVEVTGTRKGRGAILCETSSGCLILKEYSGNADRLAAQNRLLTHLKEAGCDRVESILPTKEDALSVKDIDGTEYILKTYREGRECNINDRNECLATVSLLAELHSLMEFDREELSVEAEQGKPEDIYIFSPESEYQKRNRELKRVQKYLKQRSQKTWFEICLQQTFEQFWEQAQRVAKEWAPYEADKELSGAGDKITYCHGDYQYHNILRTETGWFVVNFEKCVPDDPVRDLYLLMRKLLEKTGWSLSQGNELLEAYEKVRPISEHSRKDLYYRLSYPEKFWKIANFYYNSGKAWIPGRNLEKLEKLVEQEEEKQKFLEKLFLFKE